MPETDQWSKYKVISVLGEGSYGKVYKVQRTETAASVELSAPICTGMPQLNIAKKRNSNKELLVIKEL